MPPVSDLLEYYLSLVQADGFFNLKFIQRQKILLFALHDFFARNITMIDLCTIAQYITFESDTNNSDEAELEYAIWCCTELIDTEESNKVYDQRLQQQSQLLNSIQDYYILNLQKIRDSIPKKISSPLVG